MTEEELREKIAEIIRKPWYFTPVGIANQIVILIREAGLFMDTEMVKGLMFEAQAKKCSQCLKNREEKDYEWECEMQHRKEQSETP
jgi:hypothetical protein